jgi:hypothetical protein
MSFSVKVSRLNQSVLANNFDYRIPTTVNSSQAGLLTYIAGISTGGHQVLDINIKQTVFNISNMVRVYLARKDFTTAMGTWTEGFVNQSYNEIHLIDEINLPSSANSSFVTNLFTKHYSNLFVGNNWALLLGASVINNPLTV